ncbi:MAG: tRNA modification GTPase MnmE [Phycisphaerae bacterium]|nr:tRNA modification GTPase MnmE [Phycisphaerae bacterium]
MIYPVASDTIVAISSAWQPAALGVVRLSGEDAAPLAAGVVEALPAAGARSRPTFLETRLRLPEGYCPPATVFRFVAPRSYTGQDVIEIHTVGALPLLRALCDTLMAAGARRALPGEFSARAFVAGRISREQVCGVLGLIAAGDAAGARRAARAALGSSDALRAQIAERLTELLARVEAGIDFADEEDVRFVGERELRAELEGILAKLDELVGRPQRDPASLRPHVALAGLPNAGKSTLFNALLGAGRAIVSPAIGTTRDVLSAAIQVAGVEFVLQDCAGLAATADDLELAAHHAAERAADLADLVLWVHEAGTGWSTAELAAWGRIDPDRRLLVISKIDLHDTADRTRGDEAGILVSARADSGVERLKSEIASRLTHGAFSADPGGWNIETVSAALRRACEESLDRNPELVAGEIRLGLDGLTGRGVAIDDVLGRIFARFCVGK